MSYIKNTLLPGEEIVIHERMTGKCFIPTIAYGILSIMVTIAPIYFEDETFGTIVLLIGLVMLVRFLIRMFRLVISMISSEFAITNKRCVIKTGLFRIHVADLNLDKCEGATFSQTLWGRILNFGTIFVTTGGMSNSFWGVDRPCQLRNRISEIVEEYKKNI